MIRGKLRRRPQAAALIVTLVTSALGAAAQTAPEPALAPLSERLPAAVAEAQRAVEKVRGVPFREAVASALLPEKELGGVLESKLTEDLPAPFEAYAASLAAVGLVDPVPDLLKRIGRLYTRQVVGFYDPAQKKFYVVPERAGGAGPDDAVGGGGEAGRLVEEALLAHELTHALQDQRLDLDRRIAKLKENSDALLALESMLEGEATVVMAEVLLDRIPADSRALLGRDVLGEMVSGLAVASAGAVDGADGVPDFFVRELLFPYTAGTAWVRKRRGTGWSGIEEAYRPPPETTAEILHPDRKGGRTLLAAADLPSRAAIPQGGKALYADSLGEWALGQLLERAGAGADGAGLAAAWRDDRILFFERPGPSRGVGFSWRIRCASTAEAGRLAAALGPLYSARPPAARPSIRARGDVVAVDLGTVSARRRTASPPEAPRTAGSR
jgi:hypothetical protein